METVEKEFFVRAVHQIVKMVPTGRATSYGAIAKAIGYPNNSRMVGAVMAQTSQSEKIPAHRVVNSQGVLSGREAFGTPSRMQELLEEEGIRVVNNRISNWKKVFWNPIDEITINQ
ncbi:MAG: MGMT family protein [Dysgonomonas sp.]|nr:MGMT family protein [Dysgonomonas sp.]